MKAKRSLILSAAILILAGLLVPGVALGDQPEGRPFTALWDALNNLSGRVTDEVSRLDLRINNEGVPVGAIIMWSGTVDQNGNPVIDGTVNTNWQICDGANETPDLRGRFVVGSGGSYATDDAGGANAVTLTPSQMPPHSHSFSGSTSVTGQHRHGYLDRWWHDKEDFNGTDQDGADDHWQDMGRTTYPSGAHSHNVNGSIGTTGGNAPHENRPPYYALAFIMKIQ